MPLKVSNNARTTLAANIGTSDTAISISPSDAGKFPTLAAGDWFPMTIVDNGGNMEIVKVTARTGPALTVVRAQEGTTAKAFASGSRGDLRLTMAAINELLSGIAQLLHATDNDPDFSDTIAAEIEGKEDAFVFDIKTGNYTALGSDNNAFHRFTATATLSLTAAATLGSGWHYSVEADGGAITIDPNGTETINGVASIVVESGKTALIICDGGGFHAIVVGNPTPYVEKSANYSATIADSGKMFRFTASASLSLAAAASLMNGWGVTVFAYGGDVTISPNGSDLINGANTPYVVRAGQRVTFYCDGTAFYIPNAGLVLLRETVLTSDTASVIWNNVLSGFEEYELEVSGAWPTTNAAQLIMRLSENGGSSWATSGYDYALLVTNSTSSPSMAQLAAQSFFPIASNVGNTNAARSAKVSMRFSLIANLFKGVWQSTFIDDASTIRMGLYSGDYLGAASPSSIQLLFNSGNIKSGARFRLWGKK